MGKKCSTDGAPPSVNIHHDQASVRGAFTGSQNINQKKEGGWCKVMDIVFVSELKPAHKCIKPSDWRTERLVLIERCSFTQ